MQARIVRTYLAPDRVEEAIRVCNDSVIPALQEVPGFKNFSFFVNRENGATIFITCWENEADLRADDAFFQEQMTKFDELFRPDVRPHSQVYEVVGHV